MLPKPSPSTAIPLTESGCTPSVTGIALQRIAQGPDPLKFVIAGGKIRASTPSEDAALVGITLEATDGKDSRERSKLVLETAEANLRAGIQFLNTQNDCLQQIGAKLEDAARIWRLSRMPGIENHRLELLQEQLAEARDEVSKLKDARDGTVPLFADGQSSPIRLYHPARLEWQLLLIERSDLGSSHMIIFSQGKIYGDAPGFHLDLETIQGASDSLGKVRAANRMQANLLRSCLAGVAQRLATSDFPTAEHMPAWVQETPSANLFRTFN